MNTTEARTQFATAIALGQALAMDWSEIQEIAERAKDNAFTAGDNSPGCLPDSEPLTFARAQDAREHIAETLRERAEEERQLADVDPDAEARAKEYDAEAERVEASTEEEGTVYACGRAFWWSENPDPVDADDAETLAQARALIDAADLADLAGDLAELDPDDFADEIRQRIHDDALEISVSFGWHTPGETPEKPEAFRILLCTGGPAARICGDLSEHSEPTRAYGEFQDYGTPWNWVPLSSDELAGLLSYATAFYWGEG